MQDKMKPPKKTAEEIKAIMDRIRLLRMRWLRYVDEQMTPRRKLETQTRQINKNEKR